MPFDAITHFVFVDFENVSDIDLGLVEGKPAHVTLLIGKNQKKLDVPLVQQIKRQPAQVELVEVGASGRNALDLTLAYYLGRAVQQSPTAAFFIVSRDKDYDPMIRHLTGIDRGPAVARCDAFHLLPFLVRPKPIAPAKNAAAVRTNSAARNSVATAKPPGDDGIEPRIARVIERFRKGPAHQPKKRSTLLHHIPNLLGEKISEIDSETLVAALEERGVITIDAKGKVSYSGVR